MARGLKHQHTTNLFREHEDSLLSGPNSSGNALIQNDLELLSSHSAQWLIGVDEAGRGPLAGPVYAGAVAVHRDWLERAIRQDAWKAVHDSKKLKPAIRESLYQALRTESSHGIRKPNLLWGSGFASVGEIEHLNILEATKRAMYRAIAGLSAQQEEWQSKLPRWLEKDAWTLQPENQAHSCELLMLVDGLPLSRFPWKHQAMVQGDSKSFAIALASIVAKVERDAMMACLDRDYPDYGWGKNQGYGTQSHLKVIQSQGSTPWHRQSFLTKLNNRNRLERSEFP